MGWYNNTSSIYLLSIRFTNAQSSGGGNSTAAMWNNVNTGIGAFDVAQGSKGELINYAAKTSPEINNLKYVKGIKAIGYATYGVSSVISVGLAGNYYANGGTNSSVGIKAGIDVIMGGVGFLGMLNSAQSGGGMQQQATKWENGDGYITIEEAVNTWRYGQGKQNLNADITKLDLSKVHASDFPKGVGSRIAVNFAGTKYYTNAAQAVVYGNITLQLMENNKVLVPFQDKYDFDIRGRKGSLKRDILTAWGNIYNGFGTPFYITIYGTATIKP